MLEFEGLLSDEEPIVKQYGNRGGDGYHCPGCGRFAKFLGGRDYYNGNWNCYSFDTDCKKCGVLTTECV